MVRSVLAEVEHVENEIERLLKQSTATQTGLLVGKVSVAYRDHVYALLPTPPSESTTNVVDTSGASKKGGKGEAPLQVDPEWIGEHTRQVSRMLPGGLAVLGIYAICSEAALKAAGAALWEALTATATSASPRIISQDAGAEWLLLHVSRQPRKCTCRSGPVGLPSASGFQSLRPCELKFGHNLNTLHCLQAVYRIDLRLPIRSGSSTLFVSSVEGAISSETTRLGAAECTVDGALTDSTQTVAALRTPSPEPEPDSQTAESLPTHQVHFFARPSWASEAGAKMGEELREKPGAVVGHVALSGAVHVRTYSHPKQTVGEALVDLKTDVARSLRARLELLVEEADRAEEESEHAATSAATSAPGEGASGAEKSQPRHALLEDAVRRFGEGMPRRVLVPWLEGVRLSEYLIGSESVAEAAERCKEMLGPSFASGSDLVEVERPAAPEKTAQQQSEPQKSTVLEGVRTGSSSVKGKQEAVCSQTTLAAAVGALAVTLLAVSLAYVSR
ncbi:hypothetical protein KFL_000830320 [Klebsormidium nitens]|uniref:Protein odr-4 homolog n=1 Tax=Klebsormidium nitens TaxID=105231 RepID=A0A1Y1HSE3_KLENI|nr:hypothetical protein KFL_000830320 [Klebsormidium nitens]|eukprot:GAQ81550.1 hypothetical protein KFL_000830320 [Klebsormidium nitens]